MNPLIKKIEERLLPEFEEITKKIPSEILNVSATIKSHSFGFDEYLGHSFNLSYLLTEDCLTEVDNVALSVSVIRLASIPQIYAYVCWGHPSGCLEAEFPGSGEPLTVSNEVLEDLYKDLPRLYEALFKALKRRKPADE